jgi:magnesium-transporting ATPase (P-type)
VHHLPVHQALALLETDRERGLTTAEAARRLERHGPNLLPRVERRGALLRLALQFHHPLIYVLLVSAAATYAIGATVDASVILGVVLANAAIGFAQEARAEHALDALAAMVTVEARVIRDGTARTVPAKELVPGDVVALEPGDKISADLRLVGVAQLQVDESALTGESVPVAKTQTVLEPETVLADRANMTFSGTLVTAGHGTGVVVATGADTQLGHIHRLLGETDTLATPLTRKLARVSELLTWLILALAAVTFAVGIARGESASQMLVAAVALAVGAIPEGLPAAVTITLAIGVSRMAGRHAVVRRLPAVETLGSTTIICTDKTGTLTQNAMTVQAVIAGGARYEVTGTGYAPDGRIARGGRPVALDGDPALVACLRAGLLCNDGDVRLHDATWEPVGDPMEAALVVAAGKAGLDRAASLRAWPRTAVLPFDSERRYMATVHRDTGGTGVVFVKGAVERVLAMCDGALARDGRRDRLDSDAVLRSADVLGREGQRVLAFATRELGAEEDLDLEHADGLVFLGLQALVDPPRPEAIDAVRACREAGIAVKMITGDHAATAAAIAARVGLSGDAAPRVVTGAELATCPEDRLAALAAATDVFARVSAEQKLCLVQALQSRGDVVAMTGDGVNDAPALSQADIGVAMGLGGTEVAREAADIVLADDDFASIKAAVEEGRHTFDNLKKFIVWTLPTNMAEGLLILTAVLVGATLPILPVQILWINMTTAVLLGLTLAFERVEPGIMTRPPRRPAEPLLTPDVGGRILLVSALLLTVSFALFELETGRGTPVNEARTVAVNVFVAVEIFYLFSCRSLTGRARDLGLFSNPWGVGGVAAMVVLQLALTYAPPMNDLFDTAPIDAATWLTIVAAAALTWVVVEIEKTLRRRMRRSASPRPAERWDDAPPRADEPLVGPVDRADARAGARHEAG